MLLALTFTPLSTGARVDTSDVVQETQMEVFRQLTWNSRGHFFAPAAEAMRRILVENTPHKKALPRGGDRQRLDLDLAEPEVPQLSDDLLALDAALEELAEKDHRQAELVKLRYLPA